MTLMNIVFQGHVSQIVVNFSLEVWVIKWKFTEKRHSPSVSAAYDTLIPPRCEVPRPAPATPCRPSGTFLGHPVSTLLSARSGTPENKRRGRFIFYGVRALLKCVLQAAPASLCVM